MSGVATEIKVVPRQSPVALKWFTGDNVLEVAQWLVGHGRRPEVQLHQFGANLSLNGYKKEVPKAEKQAHGGVWISEQGGLFAKSTIEQEYEVISQ